MDLNVADPSETARQSFSMWQQGADAARAGKSISTCPYPKHRYEFVAWSNGWIFATHNIAKQELDDL